MHDPKSAHVAVLLAVYKDTRFIREQIESIIKQSHSDFSLWVSRDSLCKNTEHVYDSFCQDFDEDKYHVLNGPQKGFAQNFLTLVNNLKIQADYYAFCDHDDYWGKDKLKTAIAKLKNLSPAIPAVYCSRTTLVDVNKNEIGLSPDFKREPGFGNALVQSLASGNTMVFNNAARELLGKVPNVEIVSHDWWVYLVVTGCGGVVFFDNDSYILYRQHDDNEIGSCSGWRTRIHHLFGMFNGKFRRWNDINIKAIEQFYDYLTPENRELLKRFKVARESNLLVRGWKVLHCGVYHQTRLSDLLLLFVGGG